MTNIDAILKATEAGHIALREGYQRDPDMAATEVLALAAEVLRLRERDAAIRAICECSDGDDVVLAVSKLRGMCDKYARAEPNRTRRKA